MPELTTQDNRTLMRRTLIATGAMVGACAVIVGTLALAASAIVGHAVSPRADFELDGGGALVPSGQTRPVAIPKPAQDNGPTHR